MSTKALLGGVVVRLKSVLSDPTGKKVGRRGDGRPPANFGQWFFAVHSLGVQNTDPNSLSNDRSHAVGVTITVRMAYAPDDRRGERETLEDQIVDVAENLVADAIHQNDDVRIEANKLIAGTAEYVAIHGGSATVNGFEEPLKLANIGPPIEMPGEWAGEDSDGEEGSDAKSVLTILVAFHDARRCRPL